MENLPPNVVILSDDEEEVKHKTGMLYLLSLDVSTVITPLHYQELHKVHEQGISIFLHDSISPEHIFHLSMLRLHE